MVYLQLFLGFLKVGFFAFGGAYAAIPFIRETVLSYGWLSDEMITYVIAVSESTPGPVMVNMATYVGSAKGGILGSLIATFAVILPAFVIILLIMVVFKPILKRGWFAAILGGLQSAVIGIIAATGFYMIYKSVFLSAEVSRLKMDIKTLIFTSVLAALYYFSYKIFRKRVSPILLIFVSAVAGIFVYGIHA